MFVWVCAVCVCAPETAAPAGLVAAGSPKQCWPPATPVQDAACPTHKQVDHHFRVEGADRPAADEHSSFVAHIKSLSKELHPGLHPGIHPGAWFNLGPSKIHAAGQAPLITHAAAAKLEKLTKQYGECCILCVTDPRFYLPGKIINTQPARGIDWIIQYVLPFMYKGKWYTLMPYNKQEIPLMLRANANTGHTEGTTIRQKELHGFLESTLVTNDGIGGIGIPGLSVAHTHLQKAHATPAGQAAQCAIGGGIRACRARV